jgi:hypothetical protein
MRNWKTWLAFSVLVGMPFLPAFVDEVANLCGLATERLAATRLRGCQHAGKPCALSFNRYADHPSATE